VFIAQRLRQRFEDFAGREIVEITLRHCADPLRQRPTSFYPFVTTGLSRSQNGVVSLAYAGGPC
jgi:hypothetical protein